MEWFSLLFGGSGRGWVEAALLIGLFWAALAHPGRIRSRLMFRLAALCLGASLVAPALIQVFLIGSRSPFAGRPGAGSEGLEVAMYASTVPPMLTMLAIILGVNSVLPRPRGAAEPGVTTDRA